MIRFLIDRTIVVAALAALAYGAMWAGKAYFAGKAKVAYEQQVALDELNRKFKELENGIFRLESNKISERKLRKLIKEEMSPMIVHQISSFKEHPTHMVVSEAKAKSQAILNPEIWKHYANPDNPSAEYYFMKLYRTDDKGVKIPWAWVMYFPNREQKWKYGFYPLKIKSTTVLTKQKTGGVNSYTKLTINNPKDKQSKDLVQTFKIDPKESYVRWVEDNDKQFYWWNPSIDIGMGLYYDLNDYEFVNGVEAGFSFLGYGPKYSMDWKFVTIGLGTDFNTYWAFLRPVSVNMRLTHIPLIHHLYFAPSIGFSDRQNWLAGCSLQLEF